MLATRRPTVYALFPPLPRRDPPLHFVPRGGADEDEDERRQKVRPFPRKQGAAATAICELGSDDTREG